MMFALLTGFMAAYAQQSGGDYFEGLSRKIGFSRMIPPHGLEITYDKTVHVIFPSPIKYVDLGSTNLIAGKADGADADYLLKILIEANASKVEQAIQEAADELPEQMNGTEGHST